MNDKKLFFTSLSLLILLITADTIAKVTSFYYFYPDADMLMHLIGGFSITGVAIAVLRHMKMHNNINIFIIIFFLSIFWEYIEYRMGGNIMMNANFWIDTYTDLLMNSVGGIITYICFYNIPMRRQQKNLPR